MAAKGTVWEDRRALWIGDDGYFDGWQRDATWTPAPIVNLTEKFVYVLNSRARNDLHWAGQTVQPDRFSRNDYIRLDRAELEKDGHAWHREEYHRFYAEADLSEGQWEWTGGKYRQTGCLSVDQVAEVNQSIEELEREIKDCRRVLQREHPDKGGDADKFMATRAKMERIKAALKSARFDVAA